MNHPTVARARPRYSTAKKREIIEFASEHSVKAACARFRVSRSSIHLWTTKNNALPEANGMEEEISDCEVVPGAHEDHQQSSHATCEHVGDLVARSTSQTPVLETTTPPGSSDTTRAAFDLQASSSHATNEHCAPNGRNHSTQQTIERVDTETSGALRPAIPDPVCPSLETEPRFVDAELGIDLGEHSIQEIVASDEYAFVLVGYQGDQWGFANHAAQRAFTKLAANRALSPPAFHLTGFPQASHVLDALHNDEIQYAFVAMDLLLSNTHHAALDRLVASRLMMMGEVISQEEVCVCALPGTELCDADCVVSDWSTLQRFEEYIRHLELQYNKKIYRQVEWDSGAGCKVVRDEHAENTLVLYSTSAAIAYGLVVLQSRALGSPTKTAYAILGRCGSTSLSLNSIWGESMQRITTTRSTLLVKGTGRSILDVVSAFAYRGLEILSLHTRSGSDGQEERSYVISYRASDDPIIERGLQHHLSAASERIIVLGVYRTFAL